MYKYQRSKNKSLKKYEDIGGSKIVVINIF